MVAIEAGLIRHHVVAHHLTNHGVGHTCGVPATLEHADEATHTRLGLESHQAPSLDSHQVHGPLPLRLGGH